MTAQMLSKAEIYIDDTPAITVADIKAKLRRDSRISAWWSSTTCS